MKSIIQQNGQFYRPAGYRQPDPEELYISKTGKISTAQDGHVTDGVRLIVRKLDFVDFPGQEIK